MKRLWLWFGIAAAAVLLAALVVAQWPLHANGVTGTAIRPQYHPFGWTTYVALNQNATIADLRHAGIRIPQDVVAHRRHVVLLIAAIGAGLAVAAAVLRRLTR